MLRNKWFALPVVLLAFAMFANAGPIINVYATLGPSAYGASYDAFLGNVVSAMQSANPLVPTGSGNATYNPISTSSGVIGTITANQPIESVAFESWQGTYSPGSGEYGTDVYFVLHITDADGTFSLSQLSWLGTAPGSPDDPYSYGSPNNDTYENHRRGYLGAAEYKAGEPGTNPVDELIYVGVSTFWYRDPETGAGNEQADLNAVASDLSAFAGQYITGKYTLTVPNLVNAGFTLYSAQADVQFENGIPEPGTIALAAMGLAAMLFVRRKR